MSTINVEEKLIIDKFEELNYHKLFQLKYCHDSIINNFLPCQGENLQNEYTTESVEQRMTKIENKTYFVNWFDKNIYHYDSKKHTLKHLPPKHIYLALINTCSPHIAHDLLELFILLQIYVSYFKSINFEDTIFKCVTLKQYYKDNTPFKMYIDKFDLKDNMIYLDEEKFYKGNFVYIMVSYGCENFALPKAFTMKRSFFEMHKRIIEEANLKYKGYSTYPYLFVNRQINSNANTHWHRRELTNLITPQLKVLLFEKNSFKEIDFPVKENTDFLYQVYLANNCHVMFGEAGTHIINTWFMKPGSHFITTKFVSYPRYSLLMSQTCSVNQINFHMYDDKLETDNQIINKYIDQFQVKNSSQRVFWTHNYNGKMIPINTFNLPYRLTDPPHFIQWLDKILIQII